MCHLIPRRVGAAPPASGGARSTVATPVRTVSPWAAARCRGRGTPCRRGSGRESGRERP
ncbi:hypothetical protein GZL_05705 [Streptomyces sp. 769]|nr:hypothetical protein GZL_05705 [Streptomyces sp. 769]